MARLYMLLLLVGSIFLLQLPAAIDAIPAPDFDGSKVANDAKEFAQNLWEKTRNVFRSKPPNRRCDLVNETLWDCTNSTTSSDDSKVNPSSFSRGITAFNGFTSNIWNKTKETFTPKEKNFWDKPTRWWKDFKGFFSQATTAKPPTNFWETANSGNGNGDWRYKRAAKPCISGKQSSDSEKPCA